MKKSTYSFTATVWIYPGEQANWHFLTLPKAAGQEIKKTFSGLTRGFGSLPVTATIGNTKWNTSIFPEKTSGSYLLPLKASVRKVEDIEAKEKVSVTLVVTP